MTRKHEPGMAYNMAKLNRIFALLSFLLLFATLWVFLDDYIRPWKMVQLEARQIEKKHLLEKIKQEEDKIDQTKLSTLERELAQAKEQIAERSQDIARVKDEIKKIQKDITDETIRNGRLNAFTSDQNFKYEYAVGHGYRPSQVNPLLKKLQEYKKEFAQSQDRMKTLQAQQREKAKELEELTIEETRIQKTIDEMLRTQNLLALAKSRMEMGPVFFLRNAPFLDFADPSLKIQQLVTDTMLDDRYFQHVPKVDRCITCHTFIDRPGFENEPNPHRTHPNLELMVASESKHPMKQFGCTSCHGGEGHRVNDFNAAAHTPQNEEQKKRWMAEYNWHEPHKIPEPMYQLQYTEGQCLKCHQGVDYVPMASKLNEGIRNMEKYGCYACHKIEGWEHKRMPGPSLEKIASKVSKEFFKNWVWSPKVFNKHAMMPSFFMQSNNSTPESIQKNIAEVNAMAEFIWGQSKKYTPFEKYEGGNPQRGKELIKEVGCMGCHGVEGWDGESRQVNAYAGPYLQGTGSKIADPNWLLSWLRKPDHFDEQTIMPSMRLSKEEASDITAYLLSLKNKGFESLKFEPTDPQIRDELLMTYLTAFETEKQARTKLAGMSEREKTLQLGERSVGKYGCYSCHRIEGFADRAPIGPELSKEGSKPLTQFGFNLQHDVPHTRDGWIKAHLQNPRRWDGGLDKAFKDLTKMPYFHLTEKEVDSMVLVLLGMVDQKIPLKGQKVLDEHEKRWAEGEKLVNKFNCYGCHQIDGMRGEILAMYEDDTSLGPPKLVEQGYRVQTDWFYHFLEDVTPIRPTLTIRMPSFVLTPEERNTIVEGFQGKAKMQTFVELNPSLNPYLAWESEDEAREAKKLFNALVCTSCHTQGFNSDPALAPDLRTVKRKLRPSWVEQWLSDPQAIYPDTTMPNFWIDGEPTEPDFFEGDVKKQQRAIVKYLYNIGFDDLPKSKKKL